MKQITKDKPVKQTPASKFNFTPLVPDDHGAYVMLLFPLVVGIVVGIGQNSPANQIYHPGLCIFKPAIIGGLFRPRPP